MTNNAERFMIIYNTLETCQTEASFSFRSKIQDSIDKYKLKGNDSSLLRADGSYCVMSTLKDADKYHNNTRMSLPNTVKKEITDYKLKHQDNINKAAWWDPPRHAKLPTTWFVCYIHDIIPDTREDWQNFQCSHICTSGGCINHNHLCWESASNNQSRGNNFCLRNCKHKECKLNLCKCQGLHAPPCI
jgi:hypothetical protein